jgi:hypothetical protein
VDEIKGNTDKCLTSDNIMAGDSDSGRGEAHPDSAGAHGSVPCEDVMTRADAEMASFESTSCAENEAVREDKDGDAKRPLPDSTSEVENIQVSEDKCSEEDAPCTEEKEERCRKRRKVVTSVPAEKRLTRSSSRTPSLD